MESWRYATFHAPKREFATSTILEWNDEVFGSWEYAMRFLFILYFHHMHPVADAVLFDLTRKQELLDAINKPQRTTLSQMGNEVCEER